MPRRSRLFVKAIANTRSLGRVVVYIDGDFRGGAVNSYTPRLRSAYVSFLGLTLGRDVTTFCDLAAAPTTIDFQGPNAYNFNFATLIRYERSFADDRLSFGVAAEMPAVSGDLRRGIRAHSAARSRYPGLHPVCVGAGALEPPARLGRPARHVPAQPPHRGEHLAAGLGRTVERDNPLLPGVPDVHERRLRQGHHPLHSGPDGCRAGLHARSAECRLHPDDADVGLAGRRAVLADTAADLSGGYSTVRIQRSHGFYADDEYKRGQYIFGNLFYALTPRCTLAAEYLYGSRRNMSDAENHANRVNVMLQYTF